MEYILFGKSYSLSKFRSRHVIQKLPNKITPWTIIGDDKRLPLLIFRHGKTEFGTALPDHLRKMERAMIDALHPKAVFLNFVVPFLHGITSRRRMTEIRRIDAENVLAVRVVGAVAHASASGANVCPFLGISAQLYNKTQTIRYLTEKRD